MKCPADASANVAAGSRTLSLPSSHLPCRALQQGQGQGEGAGGEEEEVQRAGEGGEEEEVQGGERDQEGERGSQAAH